MWVPTGCICTRADVRRATAILGAFLCAATSARAQATASPTYLTTGLFIGAIEEGARIFTPVRLLPFGHRESKGHQFPTVLQLHRDEDRLLLLLGRRAGFLLAATLERYPTQPDTLWPYRAFQPPPVAVFDTVQARVRPAHEAPLPGLRAVAYLDRFPLAFIVDTRGRSLAERHMARATAMGLDITRAEFLSALTRASAAVPASGAAILVYRR